MAETSFFEMGGYAFYVWTSFGISAAVLIANFFNARRWERRVRAAILENESETES